MHEEIHHAFLIMAHSNWGQLGRLVSRLDEKSNLLIIHIDAKSNFSSGDQQRLLSIPKKAEILFADRSKINWGGYSMVACELKLIQLALEHECDYLHFLSGADYPIKSNREIQQFFETHYGTEFVNISSEDFLQQENYRFSKYHFFQEKVGRSRRSPLFFLNKFFVRLQRCLPFIDRTRKYPDIRFGVGSQWCSITRQFADYILQHSQLIEQLFHDTFCSDEVFVQTMLLNSPYYKNWSGHYPEFRDYRQCVRAIDWKRGDPYTFTAEDYPDLTATPCLFCRKVGTATPEQALLLDLLDAAQKDQ